LKKISHPTIKEVRGRGLMVAMEFHSEIGGARAYCNKLKDEGILAKDTHENIVRFAPPLVIQREEIDILLEAINMVLPPV